MARPKQKIDEQVIKEFIVDYHQKANTNGLIKPIDIHKYAEEQYGQGKFPYKLSHDFWKRDYRIGRQLLDQFNAIKKTNFTLAEGDSYDIVDVKDVLEKYAPDNEELPKYLLPMEKQLHRTINNLNAANITINKLKIEKEELEEQLLKEKERSDKMQHLLYQMFSYSSSGASLDNLINTGTSRTERVSNALKSVFNDPTEFLDGIMNHFNEKDPSPTSNVIKASFGNNKNDEEWDL